MFDEIQVRSKDLLEQLLTADNKKDVIEGYLATYNGRYKAPDIPVEMKWVNSDPISLGTFYVLTFTISP